MAARRTRVWRAKRAKESGDGWRASRYGLSSRDYDALVREQRGLCAVCGEARPLQVDHDHRDGHVRGLVCGPCNRMMGDARDDPAVLRAAAAYLEHDRYRPR